MIAEGRVAEWIKDSALDGMLCLRNETETDG
jgi:hypothetical protein